jgi:hypothetical protein
MLGYDRHSRYEEVARVQLAFENTRDAVEALRTRGQRATARLHEAHVGAA